MYINREHDALIVVDVQKDFCPGGPLAVNEGDRVVPLINRLITKFQHVVFTRDWHPAKHVSFSDDPQFIDKSWPAHCVADSPGARFHPDLEVPYHALIVNKGTDSDKEAYSSFQETGLADKLRETGIGQVFVCGLATDYCVKFTALDALELGFHVTVIEDAIRGVDLPEGSAAAALNEMRDRGAQIILSTDL